MAYMALKIIAARGHIAEVARVNALIAGRMRLESEISQLNRFGMCGTKGGKLIGHSLVLTTHLKYCSLRTAGSTPFLVRMSK